jgi:hypothetical protein
MSETKSPARWPGLFDVDFRHPHRNPLSIRAQGGNLSDKPSESVPEEIALPFAEAFVVVSRNIEEDLARAHAEFANNVTTAPAKIQEATFVYCAAAFEIQAHHHCFLVLDFDEIQRWYEPFLKTSADEIRTDAEQRVAEWPNHNGILFLHRLHGYLIGRRSHWKAEALKRVREREEAQRKVARRQPQTVTATLTGKPLPFKPSQTRDPNPDLLKTAETLNRKKAAIALGISERTLDRWIADGKVMPLGAGTRKRFKSKDLLKLLNKTKTDN